MCSYLFKKGVRERVNKPFEWVKEKYAGELTWCLDHPKITMLVATAIFAATVLLVPFIGGEFMPHLDEGALWIRATLPHTISYEEAAKFSPQVRNLLMKYPMVTEVGSELGRPDDGTDPTGFYNAEFFVPLKPEKEWAAVKQEEGWLKWLRSQRPRTKPELRKEMNEELNHSLIGVDWNFSQNIRDNVMEALSGVKGDNSVKIIGPDLAELEQLAEALLHREEMTREEIDQLLRPGMNGQDGRPADAGLTPIIAPQPAT